MPTFADPAVFEEVAREPASLTVRLHASNALALCEGHFPGDPLIPGSRLAGLAADAAAALLAADPVTPRRFARVERATFSAPARPSARIELRAVRERDAGRVAVDVTGDGKRLARVTLRFEAAS